MASPKYKRAILKIAHTHGFTLSEQGKHYKLSRPGNTPVAVAKSPRCEDHVIANLQVFLNRYRPAIITVDTDNRIG